MQKKLIKDLEENSELFVGSGVSFSEYQFRRKIVMVKNKFHALFFIRLGQKVEKVRRVADMDRLERLLRIDLLQYRPFFQQRLSIFPCVAEPVLGLVKLVPYHGNAVMATDARRRAIVGGRNDRHLVAVAFQCCGYEPNPVVPGDRKVFDHYDCVGLRHLRFLILKLLIKESWPIQFVSVIMTLQGSRLPR